MCHKIDLLFLTLKPPGHVPPPGQPSNQPPPQSGPPHPGAHAPGQGGDYNQRPPPPGAAPAPNQQSKPITIFDIFIAIQNLDFQGKPPMQNVGFIFQKVANFEPPPPA